MMTLSNLGSRARSRSQFTGAESLLALTALSICACSGDPPPAPHENPDAGAICVPPDFAEPQELVSFEALEARVEDLSGNPLPELEAQACGINLCLNSTTGADGSVSIQSTQMLDKPAFKYGKGQRYAKFAFLLENGPVHSIGTHRTVEFPALTTGVELTPGSQLSSGGVTLELAADLNLNTLNIDPFDFDTPELKRFRAVEFPIDERPPAVDETLGFERLLAMTPVGAVLCPAAGLSLDNTLGWNPGSAVEFFVHGVEVAEAWAPYGGWTRVSAGQVSNDGTTLSTNPGEGIPILSVVGVRRVPTVP